VKPRLTLAQALQAIGRPVFTTREVASLRESSLSATSQGLRRMERQGLLADVARGVWCVPAHPRYTPFALVHFLAGGHPAYVSLFSALHLHGMIEQIPQVVFAATTGHTRVVRTPAETFSFHRIHPEFFAGFDWYGGRQDFLVASPEKALVDCLYLSSRKGGRFRFFPEIDWGKRFRFARAGEWVRRIPDSRIRKYVDDRLSELRVRRIARQP